LLFGAEQDGLWLGLDIEALEPVGLIGAGGVVVPLDVQLGDEELSYALNDSGAEFIFTTADHRQARCDPFGLVDR
jgi:long-subunit acyl-CoA synthetase (AMP-forming)